MKALVFDRYGPSAELRLTNRPRPEVKPGEVLIRVAAASPNPIDWHLFRGDPLILRLRPGASAGIVGEDFSGTVEQVGVDVSEFQVGQRVFGTLPAGERRIGSIAEYVAVRPEWVAPLPMGVPLPEAGAIGLVGLTALQSLQEGGALPGARVLVWGAAGGVGHLAVRIAHLLGAARVDAVCSARSAPGVQDMGAETCFDYTVGEYPSGPYDVVIDTVCTASTSRLQRILAPGGTVVTIGALGGGRLVGPAGPMGRRAFGARIRRIRARTLMTRVNSADLRRLGEWMAEGTLLPRITASYSLDRAAAAFADLETGRVHGKLSIRIRPGSSGGASSA